jgi:hypothetical protein
MCECHPYIVIRIMAKILNLFFSGDSVVSRGDIKIYKFLKF